MHFCAQIQMLEQSLKCTNGYDTRPNEEYTSHYNDNPIVRFKLK